MGSTGQSTGLWVAMPTALSPAQVITNVRKRKEKEQRKAAV